ncbi:MAG: diguanylate cyclase [Cyanobacteria bacterium P01_H01_bin.15]
MDRERYTLGRTAEADICLVSPLISRLHATLQRQVDNISNTVTYRLVDGDLEGNRSRNGLMVNGQRVQDIELSHGDTLYFGPEIKATYQIVQTPARYLKKPLTSTSATVSLESPPTNSVSNSPTLLFEQSWTEPNSLLDYDELMRLASLSELSPIPIIEFTQSGEVTYFNATAIAQWGNIPELEASHPLIVDLLDQPVGRSGALQIREIEIYGRHFEQYVHHLPVKNLIRSYLFDITERKQISTILQKQEARYRAVVAQVSEGILMIDCANNKVIEANSAYSRLVGFTPAELLGLPLEQLVMQDADSLKHQLSEIEQRKQSWVSEIEHRHRNGDSVLVEMSVSLVEEGDESLFVCIVRDIRDRKEAEARLQYQACHDLLTGLPNRAFFNSHLDKALANANRQGNLLAVMFLDLDHFKDVNDTWGHSVGDKVLQEFARRLSVCLREGDTIARWGGDEFAILLPRIRSRSDAAQIADRILAVLAPEFHYQSKHLPLQVSIGISIYPNSGMNAQQLLRAADQALYRVKDSGRNNYQFYSSEA